MVRPKAPEKGWKAHHSVWLMLFIAWSMCYLDRAITGPVISWMIANDLELIKGAYEPHALGGLIGSMFFAGYMLTQFPAGFLGDRYGRRTMLVISTVWAGTVTVLSGMARGLNAFVAARVLTGLGEGAYYSNDRALVAQVSPPGKVGTGMGVVFVGLAVGLTAATVTAPWLIETAEGFMGQAAWSFPFFLFGPPTVVVGLIMHRRLPAGAVETYRGALPRLVAYSLFFLLVIMGIFHLSLSLRLGVLWQTVLVLLIALVLVGLIYSRIGSSSAPVLRDRSLLLMYVSAIPILFTLWFFGFWALLVVSESSGLGLSGAAVYAGLFGLANAIGYPLGGMVCDRIPGIAGRKRLYALVCVTVAVLVALMVPSIQAEDLTAMAILLFLIGVAFAAMQTVHMTLTADLSPPELMGQSFGMWNLVAEFGALLSPVICGYLRDATESWDAAIVLTSALLVASAALVMVVPRAVRY
ncbi:MAG TPA: MFS transporter [Methanomassiliicoccales archaeon]|nr:MFS transporter [Methanomassiliicoccales archaeon]